MKCIIVIKGVSKEEYEDIREDLTRQFNERNIPMPLFCLLPADYADIDIVWIDEEMEKENYAKVVEKMKS